MGKAGTVYIAFVDSDPDQRLEGHWEAISGELLELGPGWDRVDDAIAWGRERAPVVLVFKDGQHYSAGDIPDMGDASDPTPYAPWPGR
jgi:hypothetical protein